MQTFSRSLIRASLISRFVLCATVLAGIVGLAVLSAQSVVQAADSSSAAAWAPRSSKQPPASLATGGSASAFLNGLSVFGAGRRKAIGGRPQLMPSSAPGDEHWLSNLYLSGTDNEVYALAASGRNVYAVGDFDIAGGVLANNIAKWDGTSWSALGNSAVGAGYRVIRAMAADPYGNVYVGGTFTSIGGVSANHIAKWNGSVWQPMGNGLGNSPTGSWVSAIAVDANGNVYAGGFFGWLPGGIVQVPSVARWNGHDWETLGEALDVGPLAVDNSGNLYAAGFFPAFSIAKWNGSSWQTLGPTWIDCQGITAPCFTSLTPDGNGNLYASGFFDDSRIGKHVAKWNGSSWSSLGGGMDLPVLALAIDRSGNVYAGGSFQMAGGTNIRGLAKWNGVAWQPVGSGMLGGFEALTIDGSGNLYAGGYLFPPAGVNADYIAKWDGSTWSAVGTDTALNGAINAIAVDHPGSVFVGGCFRVPGSTDLHSVADWNGTSWSAPGNGIKCTVDALVFDKNGDLYAGGTFTTTGNVSANNIARWNGSTWSALGTGVNDTVSALAVDASGNLYAGGAFTAAGNGGANHIAKWDGASWSTLGAGFSAPVNALAFDGAGHLYAGGPFTMTGSSTVNNIAKWSGSSWSALGSGVSSPGGYSNVKAIAVSGNNVFVGGNFATAGGITVNNIAQWNGTSWGPLGSGALFEPAILPRFPRPPTPFVNALAIDANGKLYAGGGFNRAGGTSASNIAKWDGVTWQALGSGVTWQALDGVVNGSISALAFDSRGHLYVGGVFSTAGIQVSYYFAEWSPVVYPSYLPRVGH